MANIDPVILPPIIPGGDPLSTETLRAEIEHLKWILFQTRELFGAGILAVSDGGTGADNAADARVNLGLEIGVDVQAYSVYLDEALTFFTSTDITAAESETLTDGSDAIGLHNHNREIAARVAHRI